MNKMTAEELAMVAGGRKNGSIIPVSVKIDFTAWVVNKYAKAQKAVDTVLDVLGNVLPGKGVEKALAE